MIYTDGQPTLANRQDESWLIRLERELMELGRAERERVYRECRENTSSTFEWLACLDGATAPCSS